MPRSFGERYWPAAVRPGLYGAHGWPQAWGYVDQFCYPNKPSACYSPATMLWDVALINPLSISNGGYVLHYLRSFAHGDVNMDEECVRTKAYPDCVTEALARLHGVAKPVEGTISVPGGAPTNNDTAPGANLQQQQQQEQPPAADQQHSSRRPHPRNVKLSIILPIVPLVPVLLLGLIMCRCAYLRRRHSDANTPLHDADDDAGGAGVNSRTDGRMRRVLSSLGSLAFPFRGCASSDSKRAALLDTGSNIYSSSGGGGGRGRTMYGTGFVALLTGPDGIAIGGLLGSGSFGKVFEGMWQGRRVAVKVVTTNSAREDEKVQREIRVTSQLSHPNIVATLTSARVGAADRTALLAPVREHNGVPAAGVAPSPPPHLTATTAAAGSSVADGSAAPVTPTRPAGSAAVAGGDGGSGAAKASSGSTTARTTSSSASKSDAAAEASPTSALMDTSPSGGRRSASDSSAALSPGDDKGSPVANLFRGFFGKWRASNASSASPTKTQQQHQQLDTELAAIAPAAAEVTILLAAAPTPTHIKAEPSASPKMTGAAAGCASPGSPGRVVININAICTPTVAAPLYLAAADQPVAAVAAAAAPPPPPPSPAVVDLKAEEVAVQRSELVEALERVVEEAEEREMEAQVVAAEIDEFDASSTPFSPAPNSVVIMPVPPGTLPGTPRPPMSSASNTLLPGATSVTTNALGGLITPGATPRWTALNTPRATPRATPAGTPRAAAGGALRRAGPLFDVPAMLSPQRSVSRKLPQRTSGGVPWAKPPVNDDGEEEEEEQQQPEEEPQEAGETWIVMELCDAGSLASAVARGEFHSRTTGALDMPGVLAVLRDISRGMAYLHSRGIIHGDLKAENVMLCTRAPAPGSKVGSTPAPVGRSGSSWWRGSGSVVHAAAAASAGATPTGAMSVHASGGTAALASEGLYCTPGGNSSVAEGGLDNYRYSAKVCDFGLSRSLDPGRTHLRTAAAGSVSHMAPETLLRGEMRREADVYAFGVLLWELATGAKAYAGLSTGEVVQAVVLRGCRPALPPQAVPVRAIPEPLAELAAECWAADPESRPSFEEVLYRIDCLAMPVAVVMVAGGSGGGGEIRVQQQASESAAAAGALVVARPEAVASGQMALSAQGHVAVAVGGAAAAAGGGGGGGLISAFQQAALATQAAGSGSSFKAPLAGLLAQMARIAKRAPNQSGGGCGHGNVAVGVMSLNSAYSGSVVEHTSGGSAGASSGPFGNVQYVMWHQPLPLQLQNGEQQLQQAQPVAEADRPSPAALLPSIFSPRRFEDFSPRRHWDSRGSNVVLQQVGGAAAAAAAAATQYNRPQAAEAEQGEIDVPMLLERISFSRLLQAMSQGGVPEITPANQDEEQAV
ncbi:hypothetical protein PLESTM_000380500 [Pleodorina starrii]|nr:hypothetical protein PLESTM_000380500 [Pleodorina starrii]